MSKITWTPHKGAQTELLRYARFSAESGYAVEFIMEGSRGGGKTDAALMCFAVFCGLGFGGSWTGLVIRRTTTGLNDIIAKSKKWFSRIHPAIRPTFNKVHKTWEWPTGEVLMFRHCLDVGDYEDQFHGNELAYVIFEELTTWPDLTVYEAVKSSWRCSKKGVPRIFGSTTNPYGPGHDDVKSHFIDRLIPFKPVWQEDGVLLVRLKSMTQDNVNLMEADPFYQKRNEAMTNESLMKAWAHGDWEITAGSMFGDLWNLNTEKTLYIPPFEIPRGWNVFRSYDHGTTAPFSVGWWAVSDGETPVAERIYPEGSFFRIQELYGSQPGKWDKGLGWSVATISDRMREIEEHWNFPVWPGPADSNIFPATEDQRSVASLFEDNDIVWNKVMKGKGSRAFGCQRTRELLEASINNDPDEPHLYVFQGCEALKSTLPKIARDEKDMDVPAKCKYDHALDDTRYAITMPPDFRNHYAEGDMYGV